MNTVKFNLITLALGVLVTITHQNPANSDPMRSATGCASVAELVDFVARETGKSPLHICPRVSVTTDAVLRSAITNATGHGEEPLAVFLPASTEILLSPEIDLATLLGRSYMVHEIVHASQFDNAATASTACLGKLESEAYWVQSSYLRKNGKVEAALAFELVSMMKSACAHPYHR